MNKWLFSFGIVLLYSCFFSACQPEEPTPPPPPQNQNLSIKVIEDDFAGIPLVLAGSMGQQFIVAYQRTLTDGTELRFQVTDQFTLPVIMEDNEGNVWDLFGQAVEGPRQGEQLLPVNSYMGYWFSFGAFYPGAEIYNDNQALPTFTNEAGSNGWLIPVNNIYSGAGKDGIPSLETPKIDRYAERDYLQGTDSYYLQDNDLVIGIKIGDTYRAYPHAILDWHEIVNDTVGEEAFSVIYCPLTGTGMAWNRVVNGAETTFGVSGLLYNNNIIPYDRATNSHWSQMRGDCVQGRMIDTEVQNYQVIETTWKTWSSMFKSLQILSPETPYARDYTKYPYGTYRTNDDFIAFPLTFDDDRLPRKERVLGVIAEGRTKVYRFADF